MGQWYIARGDAKKGPFSSSQLQALARKGALRASDLVRQEGSEKWLPAGQIAGLFPAVVPDPAVVQPGTPSAPSAVVVGDREPRRLRPVWLVAGIIGVVALVLVAFLIVRA